MRVNTPDDCKNPGDFFFCVPHDGVRRIGFICPCGCGSMCGIKVREDGQAIEGAWGWDKNEVAPTCTPSIAIGNGHWHGYLRNGVFVKGVVR